MNASTRLKGDTVDELFKKRMSLLSATNTVSETLVNRTNQIDDKLFTHDQDYRFGNLYDWDMNLLEENVDFKFQKIRTHTAEGVEVEYGIQFRADYNPEYLYKDRFYRNDGKERVGFYLDVYDYSKKKYDRWLIVGKDDRVAFDRYNAFKCNWFAEWVQGHEYFSCLGCVRDASDAKFNTSGNDKLGGNTVEGNISLVFPSNQRTANIKLGQRFMLSDSLNNPQCFKVMKIKDTSPLGVMRLYMEQDVYNEHTDFGGKLNDSKHKFVFPTPILDLPEDYGGVYHRICDCIEQKISEGETASTTPTIHCDEKFVYYKGQPVRVEVSGADNDSITWHYYLDGVEYSKEDLKDCLDIQEDNNCALIKCIDSSIVKYFLQVSIKDEEENEYKTERMEIKL